MTDWLKPRSVSVQCSDRSGPLTLLLNLFDGMQEARACYQGSLTTTTPPQCWCSTLEYRWNIKGRCDSDEMSLCKESLPKWAVPFWIPTPHLSWPTIWGLCTLQWGAQRTRICFHFGGKNVHDHFQDAPDCRKNLCCSSLIGKRSAPQYLSIKQHFLSQRQLKKVMALNCQPALLGRCGIVNIWGFSWT